MKFNLLRTLIESSSNGPQTAIIAAQNEIKNTLSLGKLKFTQIDDFFDEEEPDANSEVTNIEDIVKQFHDFEGHRCIIGVHAITNFDEEFMPLLDINVSDAFDLQIGEETFNLKDLDGVKEFFSGILKIDLDSLNFSRVKIMHMYHDDNRLKPFTDEEKFISVVVF